MAANVAAMIGQHKPRVEQFQFGPWKLTASQSHILVSEGPQREKFESALSIPQFPEMIYDENILRLEHAAGFSLEFNALDALKGVNSQEGPSFKVDGAEEWLAARADNDFTKEVVKPYDWTFSTHYNGTILDPNNKITVRETNEAINIEKLKAQEKIHFFQDILLFEDELSDNGDSNMNVKVRVMPTSFFLLLRQYTRVDRVIVRINDTRLYHEAGWNYILRETSTRECDLKTCSLPLHVVKDRNEVWQHLPATKEKREKLEFIDDAQS